MEVKYNVSAFDNTPVTAGPEVHTGRAVFVDEDLYEKDASYKAKVDKCIEEGFHRVVEGESGGSGGDPGYSCTEGWVTLTDESVTTEQEDFGILGDLAYSKGITADTIKVTFNGTEYTCSKVTLGISSYYGGIGETGPDFSQYPFALQSSGPHNALYTENAGEYSIKIEELSQIVETSDCFKLAVKSVAPESSYESKQISVPSASASYLDIVQFNATGNGATINAGQDGRIECYMSQSHTGMINAAAIESINLPSGLVLRSFGIGYDVSGISVILDVYNVTANPITTTAQNVSASGYRFRRIMLDPTAIEQQCILVGECGGK